MPQVMLDRAGIVAVVGDFEARGMAEPVGMDGNAHLGGIPGAGNDRADRGIGHGAVPLGHEHIRCARVLAGEVAQGADLWPDTRKPCREARSIIVASR